MVKDTTYYDLLGVQPTATVAEIRKAYRLQALRHHPDRNNNTPEATAAFQHLKAVYEILSDSDRREEYDTSGPPSNIHSDDPAIDADAVAAFFTRTKKVTEEDIIAYERTYRNGDDEREDLDDFFVRANGAVESLIDYIPYSDESDLIRFVKHWDGRIEKGQLQTSDRWVKARKRLIKRGKGKERNMDLVSESKAGSKKGKASKEDTGLAALADMIRQRQERGKEEFEQWCAEVEEKERKGTQKMKAGARSSKASKDSALKARRQIKKKRKSST